MLNNRSENVAPQKGSDKLIDISKELSVLGKEKERLLGIVKENKDAEDKLTSLKNEVVSVGEEVRNLNYVKEELLSAKEEINKLNSNQESLRKEYGKELDVFEDDLTKVRQRLVDDEIKLANVKKELSENTNSLMLIDSTIVDSKKELEKINAEIETQQDNLEKIKTFSDNEESLLLESIIKTREVLTTLKTEILELSNKKISTEKECANLIDMAEQQTLKANEYSKKMREETDDYCEKKNNELIKREGECSDHESLFKIREDLLRDIKIQLEEKIGKRITNINI